MEDRTNQRLALDKTNYVIRKVPIILLILFLFVDLIRLFDVIPVLFANVLYVLLGLIAIIYSVLKNGIKKQIPIFCFIYFYIFFGALGIISNGNIDPQELLWPFAFIGIATLFLNFKINYKFAKVLYYFVAILLMTKIIISGGVNNLNTASSRNTIGIMILIYFSIYAIASYTSDRKMTIYPVLLGLLVNVMAIGRSGILTSLLLVILFLPFKFDGKKHKIRNPIKSFFVLFVGAIMLWISYSLLDYYFAAMISNFQNRGLESIRILIWSDYLEKTFTSIKYIFFGTPISGTYLLNMYNDNLHNSFFMLHAKYGLIPLMTVVVLIVKAFIHFIKTKNVLYFILLFALIFRMQFDYTNFNAQLDIILFYLMFFPYIKNKYSVKIKIT